MIVPGIDAELEMLAGSSHVHLLTILLICDLWQLVRLVTSLALGVKEALVCSMVFVLVLRSVVGSWVLITSRCRSFNRILLHLKYLDGLGVQENTVEHGLPILFASRGVVWLD
jgi:hypothetical protein